MQVVAKFIQSQWSNVVLTQEIIESVTTINFDINTFGEAEFEVPLIDGIQEDVKVELYEVSNSDTLIFRGYVYQVEPFWNRFGQIKIIARSEKGLFERRLVLQDKNFSGTDIQALINNLLSDYNSGYGENWSLDCNINKPIDLELQTGDNYYDILNELAEQCSCNWDIQNGVVLFKTTLGQDKTSGINYQEITFNGTAPSSSNISNIQVKGLASRANVVVSQDKNGVVSVNNSQYAIDGILYGVAYNQYRNGDITEKEQKFLDNVSKIQRTYQVSVEANTIDADIGDKIKLTVENTNNFFDYDGDVTVTKKLFTYNNGLKQIQYEVSNITLTPFTLTNYLRGLKRDIQLIRL